MKEKLKIMIQFLIENWFKIAIIVAIFWIAISIARIADSTELLSLIMRQKFFPLNFNF